MDIKSLLEAVAVPLAVGVVSYLAGRRKNTVEIKKTEAEIEKMELDKRFEEIELFEKINKILSAQNIKLEAYISQLELRIIDLEKTIENQNIEKCKGDSCPTKIEYDKIMASREKRRKKRHVATLAALDNITTK